MIEGGKKKVSKKKKATQRWKYLKDIYAELDMAKERLAKLEDRVGVMSIIIAYGLVEGNYRLDLIERLLGGKNQ